MNYYESCLRDVAKMEENIFSDRWTFESIKDSLKHDYNTVMIMLADKNDNITFNLFKSGNLVEPYNDVCEIDTKCIGYIISSQVAEESELLRIALEEKMRGKNLGKTLLEEYLRHISKECDKFFLEVRESNDVARSLYEKMGYINIAKRKAYYSNPSEDGIIYQLIPNKPN